MSLRQSSTPQSPSSSSGTMSRQEDRTAPRPTHDRLLARVFECRTIVDCILSHCTVRTLGDAARVCKAWTDKANHYLYKRISFPSAAPFVHSRHSYPCTHSNPYSHTRAIDYHSHESADCQDRDSIPLPSVDLIRVFCDGTNTLANCRCDDLLPHACHLVGGVSPKALLISAITTPIARSPCDLAWLVAENLTRVVIFLKPDSAYEEVPKEERLYRGLPPTIQDLTLIFQPHDVAPQAMFGPWTKDWSADLDWSCKKLVIGLADLILANPDQQVTICDAHHLGNLWSGGIDRSSGGIFKMHVLREVAIRGMKEGWTPEKLKNCVRGIRCISSKEFAEEAENEMWFTREEKERIPL